ncbi:MAG: DnaD domain protein [Oscillospiraceae bacterium]|nr:DnaD domain protein [Oscillospiraceae bacterium]
MIKQENNCIVSPRAADILIARQDGDMALLYLYLCRTGCHDRERAGRELFLPRQRLNEAYERLEMCGLLPPAAQVSAAEPVQTQISPAVPAGDELPASYTAEDIKGRAEHDSAFSALIAEAALIIGRPLSTPDLIKLLGIYDHYDLPAEVIMELMNHVAEDYREKYGESRRPSAHAFEREARIWVERGITDFDAAEQFISRQRERRGIEAQVREAMGIPDRDFTDTEKRKVSKWLDWGFGPDAIALAYDKTVTNTHKISLAYMDRILTSWHEKGLHSLKEIQEKDRPASISSGRNGRITASVDPGKLQDIVDRI